MKDPASEDPTEPVRSPGSAASAGASAPGADFESVLARCIEQVAFDGLEAIEAACRTHPNLAERLRNRIGALSRAGLLPSRRTLSPPIFGRYRIVDTLGRGAMGVVYLAEDLQTKRQVAIKTLPIEGADVPDRVRERFLREARAAAQLSHPNIVPVFDVGEEAGVLYYAMEPIDGVTLAQWLGELRKLRITPADIQASDLESAFATLRPGAPFLLDRLGRSYLEVACRIAAAIATALAHVHTVGIVHRDVKPSNIMLARDGRVLLFDLGLAHLADAPALTRSGEFAGSPYYASPEQIAGRSRSVDQRSDVYSLGVTLYEMLTLRLPFPHENAAALVAAITNDDPPSVRSLSPLVPLDLATVCEMALEKEVARRYPSAAAMAEDLHRILDLRAIRARPTRAIDRLLRLAKRRPAATSALTLLAVLLIGAPIGLFVFNREIAQQRDQAEASAQAYRREAEKNQEVSTFWEELVLELDASEDASTRAAAAELLRRGVAQVEGERLEEPLARAVVLETLGRVQGARGRHSEALRLFDQALALRTSVLGEHHAEVGGSLYHLARTHLELGNLDSARALATRCIESLGSDAVAERPTIALARIVLGDVALRSGEFATASAHFEEANQALAGEPGRASDEATALERSARAFSELGDLDRAEQALRASLELRHDLRRPRLADIARILLELGHLRARRQDPTGAEERFDEALGLFRKAHGDVSLDVLETLEALDALPSARLAELSPQRHATLGWRLLLLVRNRRLLGGANASDEIDRALLHCTNAGKSARSELASVRLEQAIAWHAEGRGKEADALLEHELAALAASDTTRETRRDALALRIEIALEEPNSLLAESLQRQAIAELEDDPGSSPRARAQAMLALAKTLRLRRPLDAPSTEPSERAEDWEWRAAEVLSAVAGDGSASEPAADPPELALDGAFPLRRAAPEALARYDEAFQRGITALQSSLFREAIAEFSHCLELLPHVPVCSYNIACARARSGDVEGAFESLERAVADGFGFRDSDLRLLESDADLEALRADDRRARVDELVERVRTRRDQIARAAEQPAFYVPEGLDLADRHPLVIVAHRHGATKEAIVADPQWRAIAERAGAILAAASGSYAVSGSDAGLGGMTWVEDIARYRTRFWHDDRPVMDALQSARRNYKIDPTRVILAGEGLGGMIAFDVALRAPGSFRGVVMRDATVHLDLTLDRAVQLRTLGLRVVLVPSESSEVEGVLGPIAAREHAQALAQRMRRFGVDAFVMSPSASVDFASSILLALERLNTP